MSIEYGVKKYPHLFDPLEIRGKVYKNRLMAAPTMFAHSIFTIPPMRENVYRMVENRAKGGFASVSTGEIGINFEEGKAAFTVEDIDYSIYEGKHFEMMKEYADRIKKHGAIAILEFSHEGLGTMFIEKVYGPVDMMRPDGTQVYAMDETIMQKICDDTERAFRFARECGFDGAMFHGGHSFIFQQFMSNLTNQRTDEYGGSIENRAKFPIRIMEAARRGLGEDKILEIRISAEDGIPVPGALTVEETAEFCKLFDGIPDIIQVSNGMKIKGNGTGTFSDFFAPHGLHMDKAAKIKAVVKKSKVGVIGGFNDPAMCEDVIASGKADFISMGRQCYADPDFPVKTLMGREDNIRKCVRCFHCYPGFDEHPTDIPLMERLATPEGQKIYAPSSMGDCAINPKSGFFNYPDRLPAPTQESRVLIVGGGVAGLQAAITAKERGHFVTLIEKTGELGGTLNFTAKDNDKMDLDAFRKVLIKEALECGANIMLNTECSAEIIEKVKPDVILAAVGGSATAPEIPGIETALKAADVYDNMDAIGKNVIMLGGGLVGCEVALHLASYGHQITVIDIQGRMAPETFGYYRNALLNEMDKRGIVQKLSTSCNCIAGGDVFIIHNGNETVISADTIVYALGMEPNEDIVNKIKRMAKDIPVITIGDCSRIGKVAECIRSGYDAAMAII